MQNINILNFWPWNLSQGHVIENGNLANINLNLYKSRTWVFFVSFYHFADIKYYDFQKFCDVKIQVKVRVYKIHNGTIWWPISTSIKVPLEHFSLALTIFQIYIIWFPEIVWPWKYRSRSRCTTFALAPFDGKYLTSYLMAIVMFAPSPTNFAKYSLK